MQDKDQSPDPSPIEITHTKPTYITYGTALQLCCFTAIITLLIVYFSPGIATRLGFSVDSYRSTSRVVYLDFDRIMNAGIQKTIESSSGVNEVKKDAEIFQKNLNEAIQNYNDAGYVIVNFKAIIGTTPANDVTDDLLKKIGLTQKPQLPILEGKVDVE